MRRTKAEAQETRETILDAAELSFLELGVSKTSLDYIAKKAGITRGAIYFHFRDKTDIFRAIIDRICFPEEELVTQASQNDSIDPIDIIEKAANGCFESFAKDEQQQRVLTIITLRCEYVGEFSDTLDRLYQAHKDMLNLFERLFEMARLRGTLSPLWTPQDASRILVSTVGGIIHEWLRMNKNFDLNSLGIRILKNQLDALRSPA